MGVVVNPTCHHGNTRDCDFDFLLLRRVKGVNWIPGPLNACELGGNHFI